MLAGVEWEPPTVPERTGHRGNQDVPCHLGYYYLGSDHARLFQWSERTQDFAPYDGAPKDYIPAVA